MAIKGGLPPGDAKAAGLLMAAEALNVDTGDHDDQAWAALLKFNGLPATITHADAMAANSTDENLSAGGPATLELFKATLKAKGVVLE